MNRSVWNFGLHCQHRGAFLTHILSIFGHFKLNQNERTLVIVVYLIYFIAIQLKFSGKEGFFVASAAFKYHNHVKILQKQYLLSIPYLFCS